MTREKHLKQFLFSALKWKCMDIQNVIQAYAQNLKVYRLSQIYQKASIVESTYIV